MNIIIKWYKIGQKSIHMTHKYYRSINHTSSLDIHNVHILSKNNFMYVFYFYSNLVIY